MIQRFQRKNRGTIPPKKVIYIFSEGKVTEPKYFEAIRKELKLPTIHIKPLGTGYHTVSLVEYVIKAMYTEDEPETEWWVVFDKDSWKDFDKAIALAKKNNISVAYSNECFELWFILHYDFLDSDIGRKGYNEILSKKFGYNYEHHSKESENSAQIYNLIKDKEVTACKYAEKLLKAQQERKDSKIMAPATTVHLLVKSLRALKL